jgi:hypothetical protein
MKTTKTQVFKKLLLIFIVLIYSGNTHGAAIGDIVSAEISISADTVIADAPAETIDIAIFSNQVFVTIGNSKSEYASVSIVNSQGKVVYLNENVSANSSTTIIHEGNNTGASLIVYVILGKQVVYKKFIVEN